MRIFTVSLASNNLFDIWLFSLNSNTNGIFRHNCLSSQGFLGVPFHAVAPSALFHAVSCSRCAIPCSCSRCAVPCSCSRCAVSVASGALFQLLAGESVVLRIKRTCKWAINNKNEQFWRRELCIICEHLFKWNQILQLEKLFDFLLFFCLLIGLYLTSGFWQAWYFKTSLAEIYLSVNNKEVSVVMA